MEDGTRQYATGTPDELQEAENRQAEAPLKARLREADRALARIVDAQSYARQLTELHQAVYQSLAWEAVGQRADRIKAFDDALLKQLKAFQGTLKGAAEASALDASQRDAMAAIAKGFDVYAKVAADTVDIKSAGVATAASYVITLDGEYRKNQDLLQKFVKTEVDAASDGVETTTAMVFFFPLSVLDLHPVTINRIPLNRKQRKRGNRLCM